MSDSTREELIKKIKTLNETIWERKITKNVIDLWIQNFNLTKFPEKERCYALYLLSQFMFFGENEVREMLKSLYRDLYKYPIISEIRKKNKDTTDIKLIEAEFKKILESTKFIGAGQPSGSGSFLSYSFRQQNSLPEKSFTTTADIINKNTEGEESLRFPQVTRYIFIDDLIGSGSQATKSLKEIVLKIKSINSEIHIKYLVLFAHQKGLKKISEETEIDQVKAVFELDDSFRCFNKEKSRYFVNYQEDFDQNFAKKFCRDYGKKLYPGNPLGYKNGQLLLGFYHNTPNHTLPIFWSEGKDNFPWNRIFSRYGKGKR